jgi:hypothetical protein
MTAEQVSSSNSPVALPTRCEHLLALLDVAVAGQTGLISFEDGIDATPLKVTYAEQCDRARARMFENHVRKPLLTKSIGV